jgi:hypothetical protein
MTQADALTRALVLAISAPTDEQSQRATALAIQLTAGLTAAQVEESKATALQEIRR